MNVAVVTDAVSAGSYFPAWYAYYGGIFGTESIHIFTYLRNRNSFEGIKVGGLHALADTYNDNDRKDAIAALVAELLPTHDLILHVDIDEFLIPDPIKFRNLSEYLASWSGTHLTAFGFDVIQSPSEPPLDIRRPILSQRSFAYALTALNKTCVTRVPLKWNRGFHYCSLPPTFGDLYLFHTKRADIGMQVAWNEDMRAQAGDDKFLHSYYGWDAKEIESYHTNRLRLPLATGPAALVRTDFNRRFMDNIRYIEDTGIFDGPYDIEQLNVLIPEAFRHFF
jgi:hypothetical protein